jgi:hypothetical protein
MAQNIHLNTQKDTVVHLAGVTATARKTEWKSDGVIVHVSPSETKTVNEILRQSPGVSVTDKDILINGTGGVKVLVNDHELKLTGEELLNYLKSVPGQSISRVEVQPHADASMGADDKGGVIKLFLRKRTLDGLQANVSSRIRLSHRMYEFMPSVFISMRMGKVTLYSSFSRLVRPENKGCYESERMYGNKTDMLTGNGDISEPYHYKRYALGMEWNMDSLNSLDADIEYTEDSDRKHTIGESSLNLGSVVSKSESVLSQFNNPRMYSFTVNYRRMLDDRGSCAKILTDYIAKRISNDNFYTYHYPLTGKDSTNQLLQNIDYDIFSEDVSLKKVFLHESYLQTGLKYTYTQMKDLSLQTVLKYHEHIGAAYAMFGFEKEHWNVNGGLRMEYMRARDATGLIDKRCLDLFPHLNVNYSFDDMKKLMLIMQYAKTIERPDFYAMNPTRVQSSEYAYSVGNPYLKPTYGHHVNATFVYDYRYTFTLGANFYQDMIRPYSRHDAGNKLEDYVTYENHSHENHFFIAVTAPFNLGNLMRLTTNFTGVRQQIQKNAGDKSTGHYLVFADALLQARINSLATIELEYNMHSRLYTSNSQIGSIHLVNASVKHEFLNGKLTVSAGIDDILNQQNRYRMILDTYTTNTHINMAESGRVVKLTVSWNINRGKKVKEDTIEKSASAERERLEMTKKGYK